MRGQAPKKNGVNHFLLQHLYSPSSQELWNISTVSCGALLVSWATEHPEGHGEHRQRRAEPKSRVTLGDRQITEARAVAE